MRDVLYKSFSEFNSFPVFLQVGCIAFSWVFLFFTVDAWFSPFYFHGYQLISYAFVVLLLSSWLAHQAIFRLIKSSILWDCSTDESSALRSCRELTIKDICDGELSSLAKSAAESVINYWCDDSNNNEEFVKEIHNQIEDIFYTLSEKLSKIKIEYFVKNLVLIVHNHLRSYIKTMSYSSLSSTSPSKFSFTHPVSRGEIPLEVYLDSLSHAVMKEFIPGSIQDCSAVFDLSCAAFCSQVLIKFVDNLSQPGLVLQAVIQILESIDETVDSTDATLHSLSENSLQEISDISESSRNIQDPQDRSSPRPNEAEEEIGKTVDPESNFQVRNGSPVLAGSLSCNNLATSTQPVAESSWVKSGLCSSLSTATAPLIPSHCTPDSASEEKTIRKPSSLPLIAGSSTGSDDIGVLDLEQNASTSVDADVSPVYEDVEDFATAIAKLRSLLEQRNSTTDVSCGKNSVLSPITGDTRTFSSGGETESSFEELTEASELPNDSRIFFGIKIPRTEVCTLPGEGQHSFYCIVYDGIYTAVSTSLFNNVEDVREPKDSRLVLKSRTVRRRFRQFMQLHAQLEASEDPSVSKAIRSIRGPSKWLNLPFSRLDQNTVAHRQVFLERYMQQLCTSPSIGMSGELRNFLDYELHLNEISVTPSNAALQRVPFFAKTVSGVLQSIKTALPLPIPGFDNDQSRPVQLVPLPLPSPSTVPFDPPEREGKSSQSTSSVDEVDSPLIPLTCRVTYASEESKLEQLLNNWNHMDCRVESAYEAFESHLWRSELNIQLSQDTAALDAKPPPYVEVVPTDKNCEPTSKAGWDRFDGQLPLSSSLINLIVECLNLRETWLTKAPVPLALKIAIGKRIENYFQESLLELTNPNRLADNLRSLRQKLGANSLSPIVLAAEDKDANELVREVITLLNKKLPGLVVRIIGEDLCSDVLKTAFSCLTDAQLNRDLALTLLDFMFLQICAIPSSIDRTSPIL